MSQIEIDEVLRFMSDVAPKVSPDNHVPNTTITRMRMCTILWNKPMIFFHPHRIRDHEPAWTVEIKLTRSGCASCRIPSLCKLQHPGGDKTTKLLLSKESRLRWAFFSQKCFLGSAPLLLFRASFLPLPFATNFPPLRQMASTSPQIFQILLALTTHDQSTFRKAPKKR